ncbi:heat shock protein beta-2-like isoform X2 [Pocillopora damicornis]|nr:heat shock protein beta-2-like isoform X2 [Pocillopora damicornis]
MALVFRFPVYHPCNYYKGVPGGFDFFHNLWREIALAYEQEVGNPYCRKRQQQSHKGAVKIASVPLNQYKPEDITLEVDSDKVTLHGQHRSEREDGFDTSEFKRVFKLPQDIDPTTVTSRTTQDGGVLVVEGSKRVEEKEDDGKFEIKLDVSGFKPEEIKVQIRGNELSVSGKHKSEDGEVYRSRDYSRRIVLPNDVVLGSVSSRLSKESLLTIEASRDPALLPSERAVDITMETDEPEDEPKPSTSGETAETEE